MNLSGARITPPRKRLIADAALLGIAAIWGSTFFMVKDATQDFPVLAFLALRFSLATLGMLPFALRVRRWPRRTEWIGGIGAGLLLCASYIFQTFSMRLIASGRTGFITGLYVIMVPFLALLLLKHKIRRRVLIGTGLALVGLVLLSYAPGGDLLGDGLAFLCALAYALQILVVERFPKAADWRIMSTLQIATVAAICGVLLPMLAATRGCGLPACIALRPMADPIPDALPFFVLTTALFTGLAASSLAFSVQIWAQRILPPSDTALIFAMESPFSALFGALFRGEALTLSALLGCSLILSGMLVTSLSGQTANTPAETLSATASAEALSGR